MGSEKRRPSEWKHPGVRGTCLVGQGQLHLTCTPPLCRAHPTLWIQGRGLHSRHPSPPPGSSYLNPQVLLWARWPVCWPGFLSICQLFTVLHSLARAAADTSASSLPPFLFLPALFLSECQRQDPVLVFRVLQGRQLGSPGDAFGSAGPHHEIWAC